MNFVECIGRNYPNVQVCCHGDPTVYKDLEWHEGDPIPTEEDLVNAQLNNDRADMDVKIQAERYRREQFGGTNVMGKWFHSDDTSKIKQNSLKMMADLGFLQPIEWRLMDKSYVTLTPELISSVFVMAAITVHQIFQIADAHRATMLTATDPANYDFSHGWPEEFRDIDPTYVP